jgi:hypothetical protein
MGTTRVLLVALLGLASRPVPAQGQLLVSGSPPPLVVSAATAGSAPVSVTNSSTTYTLALTLGTHKLTGQINAGMPTGTTLSVTLAAPPGATSQGAVALSTTPRDLVTNINLTVASTRSITYQLSATSAAGVVPAQTRTVTLTLTSAP